MPLNITDSDDILILDTAVTADLCEGILHVNLDPTTWIGAGAGYAQGAKVKITNPVGIVVKDYGDDFDIDTPFIYDYEYTLPTTANNYQYGDYKVEVTLTDAEGNEYTLEKTVNICPPNSKNKTKRQGCLSAQIIAKCKDAKVLIILNNLPPYKGKAVASQENDLELEYPTGSETEPLSSTYGSFSAALYEGVYRLTGTVCGAYNMGDNVVIKVPYKVDCDKRVICKLDECCVQAKLDELYKRLDSDCTTAEKENTNSLIFETLTLLQLAKGAQECGEDPSDYIVRMEGVLGCTCSCNCDEGSSLGTPTPAEDIIIEGCGFTWETGGLTKVLTIYNRQHKLISTDRKVTISDVFIDEENCETRQLISVAETEIPEPPTLCEMVDDYTDQMNGVNPATYRIPIIIENESADPPTCLALAAQPPTQFAVAGEGRVSMFGSMEWFNTLTAANEAAEAGESVIIYGATDEDLTPKDGVNYYGFGQASIRDFTLNGRYAGSIANITMRTVNIVYEPVDETDFAHIHTSNVIVNGFFTINGNIQWHGGHLFFDPEMNNCAQIRGRACFRNWYSTMPVVINGSGTLAHFDLEFTGPDFEYYNGFTGALQGGADSYKINHGNVYSLNTKALFLSAERDYIAPRASHITSISDGSVAVEILINPAATGTSSQFEYITGKGVANDGIRTYYNYVEIPGNTNYDTNMQAMCSHMDGYSVATFGGNPRSGGFRQSVFFSEMNYALYLRKGSDYAPNLTNTQIIDCIAESPSAPAVYTTGNVYIFGGKFICDWNSGSSGSGILVDVQETDGQDYHYQIIGVTTVVRNNTAYAIRSTAAVEIKVMDCNFTSRYADNTAAIDPQITPIAITIDAYGNKY